MTYKQESPVLRAESPASDLLTCYDELLSGTPIDELHVRYVRVEVLAAQELFEKGFSRERLRNVQERRAKAFIEAQHHESLECRCGLLCFDLAELTSHLNNLSGRSGHGLRAAVQEVGRK